ncbi:MAG: GGDEF domain-containing protein [Deltaproteobacteria bacterium]|nr:GGDEF domain-containing protein [Deltaproteobacteria bacterium]
MTPERRRQRAAAAAREQRPPVAGDETPRVLIVARDGTLRAQAAERVAALGLTPREAERVESVATRELDDSDAVLFLPHRAAVPVAVALARLRALAPTGALVLAAPDAFGPNDAIPGVDIVQWPAADAELARALRRAMAAATAARRLEALRAPARMHAGLPVVVTLGGPDGHPGWFLDALLSTCAEGLSGGAVLAPATDGYRVLEVRGIRESHVLRLARRHPPATAGQAPVRHVRMGRRLRSTAAQLRALREWWWLPAPAAAGVGGLTFVFQERGAPELPWLAGALDLVAAGLGAETPPEDLDPETGLTVCGGGELARVAAAVAMRGRTPGAGPAGAAVVLLTMPDLRAERREHGPRAEARLLAAVLGRIRRAHRPHDRLLRLGPETLGLVVPARGARDAERMADRVLARFDGARLLRRDGEESGGRGERFELEVRAVFVDGSEDPQTLAQTLARIGVPAGER